MKKSLLLCQLDSLFLTSRLILEEDLCLCEQMVSSRSTHLALAVEIELLLAILPTKFQILISLAWFGSWDSLPPTPS